MAEFKTETGVIFYELLDATQVDPAAAPTLTLLHNFMSSGRSAWGPLLSALSRHFRILLPDLPGHARSLGHPDGFLHTTIARQLAALMAATGAQSGHLAGCSSGGMLAQLMVHHQLLQPATLTLVSTTHSTNGETTGNHRSLLPEHFQAGRKWMEATALLHDPIQGQGYYADELLPGFRALTPSRAIDLPLEALAAFNLPVCIIHGDHDEFFPVSIPRRMTAALPDVELHLVPHQTHALLFRQPWRVAEIMVEFLLRHASTA